MLNNTWSLIQKEIQLEFRNKQGIYAALLYVVSTVFVCYLSFKTIIAPPVWNALLWIIILFSSVNAAARSFSQEQGGRLLYLYTLASAQSVVLAKMIYNIFFVSLISLTTLLFYSILIGNLVADPVLFSLNILLGASGFSAVLTLVSGIAAKTNNNFSMMTILSLPVMIPLLLTLIKVSKNAVDGLDRSVSYQFISMVGAIDVIVIILALVLFPYLWRD